MEKIRTSIALGFVLLSGVATCFAQDESAGQHAKKKVPAVVSNAGTTTEQPDSTTVTPVAPVDSKGYIIGEADLLHINVYKETEFSQNVIVRPDGMISLPLVSEVKVSGKTPLQVQEELAQSLRSYIVDPQVTVTVIDVRSKSVYVTGEVGHPDAYPLLMPTTVLQMLAKAGGPTLYANRKGIFILRTVNGKQEKIPFPYNDVLKGKKSDQDIPLRAGDTIVVP